MLKKISSNPTFQLKNDYIKLFDVISIFFKQLKITKEEIEYGLTIISEMKEKFLYITDIYSISPEEFPGLPTIFSNNYNRLEQTFNYVSKNYNTANLNSFYGYISELNSVFTEQYLKIAIEGLYQGIITKKLPLLPAVEAQEKLSFSIESLNDFFNRIIPNPNYLSDVLFELQNIGNNLPTQASTYFILLAKLFSSMKNIELDDSSSQNVAKTMILQIKALKEKYMFSQSLILTCDETPTLKKQKIETYSYVNIYEKELDAKDVFSKLYSLCRDKAPHTSGKIAQIETCINQMYAIYNAAPTDFSGLPGIFLKDANALFDRCSHFISNKQDVMNELDKFNQQMVRRYFQLQVNHLYNNIFCDHNVPSINNDKSWQLCFASIETALNRMRDKMETAETKTKAQNLIDTFVTFKEILLLEESLLPSAKHAKLCLIALDNVLQNSVEIWNLPFKILEKTIDAINEMHENLTVTLENELTQSNVQSTQKRIQVIENTAPSKALPQAATTTFVLVDENSSAYNLYTAKYSVPSYSTPFSFFTERKSTLDLRRIAKSKGLSCEDVEGDGNCLFTAVAVQLKQKRSEYSNWQLSKLANKLREDACNYLEAHEENYKSFVPDEDYKAFIKRTRNPSEWAGHLHLIALCEVLPIRIVVINSDNSKPIVIGHHYANDVICLGYEVNLHYQVLTPIDKSNKLPSAINELIKNHDNENTTAFNFNKN